MYNVNQFTLSLVPFLLVISAISW